MPREVPWTAAPRGVRGLCWLSVARGWRASLCCGGLGGAESLHVASLKWEEAERPRQGSGLLEADPGWVGLSVACGGGFLLVKGAAPLLLGPCGFWSLPGRQL